MARTMRLMALTVLCLVFPGALFAAPSITSLSPTSGPVGTSVTIAGTSFGTTQGTSTVTFNGLSAVSITSWTATSIVATVPTNATNGNVLVTVGGVASNGVSFTVVTTSALPQVVQVQPANSGTSVPLNGRVVVRFAQPVQPISIVSGTLTLVHSGTTVAGSVAQSNDGLSLTFIPTQNLAASTTYTVSVTDIAGNQTTPEFQSTFTTGTTTDATAPRVVLLNPPSAATGVPINAPLVVQFTKPMDPSTLTPQAFAVTDGGLSIAGTVQVDPTGLTASFVPSQFLGVSHYISSGNLGSSIRDTSGNSLSGGGSFAFTTSFSADSQGATVVGISPSNSATSVPRNSLVVLECDKPLDVISVSAGFQVQLAGQPVAGGIALSDGNKRITFTPSSSLAATTTYTVVTTALITDVGGFALVNPGSSTFTTSGATDATTPTVSTVTPASTATGVPTNAITQVQFSKQIDPLTVTTTTLQVSPQATNIPIAGSTTVSADGKTSTFIPSTQLVPWTRYQVSATNGIADLEGHALTSYTSIFTTGQGPNTTAPTVVTVSPSNGISGVPVNIRINAVMSTPLSAASVGSNAMTVTTGGTSVTGTITLSSDRTTLTFVPSSLLAVSTTYTVTVSSVTDQAGNALTTFTSSFTTGTSGTQNTTKPTVATVSPSNGASGITVGSTIVLTFNEPIDLTTVNTTTVPIARSGYSGSLAGTYSLDGTGKVLTFTPLSQLPGSSTITVQVTTNGVSDLSGNLSNSFFSSFSTAAVTDTTPPTVVSVTPNNGATGVGQNATVVLTFSKSLNSSTITGTNIALLANGSKLGGGLTYSADNRVVTWATGTTLPSATVVTVVATSGVKDLSGNSLANFSSQFTTAPAFDTTHPSVFAQRPGNGAYGVPLNTNAVLYVNDPMNASSVQGAMHVSQNGVLVNGTTQVTDSGQVAQFTPQSAWSPNSQIQVFLDSTAQDLDGNSLNSYQGSFTTVANTSNTAPTMVSTNPTNGATGVPTNLVIDVGFNQPLNPATITGTSVACYQNNAWLQGSVNLLYGGTVLQFIPRLPLTANTSASCQISTSLQGTNGISFAGMILSFTTGAGTDTAIPTVVSYSPPNGSSNVGDNADVRLLFSKPINPLTINTSTIQLSGGGTTSVPDSVSFSNNNQNVLLVPHAPLPDNTQMTLIVSGVTDVAGNAVASQTTHFTTGTGPDVVRPVAVSTNPFANAVNVPTNAVVVLQVSEPIDPGTVNSSLTIQDSQSGQVVAGTYSVSSDGQTITFLPSASLATNRIYSVTFIAGQGITDLAGNLLAGSANASNFNFTTGTTASTTAPQVLAVSPANGAASVGINGQVMIQFNEPVNAAKLSGVTLSGGSGAVNVTQTLTNGNQALALIPVVPLAASTTYTVTISGVQDLSGNALASPVTTTFTTAAGADLIAPTVSTVTPANGASSVSINTTVQVQFSKVINPLTITNATFKIYPNTTTIPVAGTIVVAGNLQSVTFTPSQPLDPSTVFVVTLTSGVTDLVGQALSFSSVFTTATGSSGLPPAIASLGTTSGAVGSSEIISGTYFGTSQGTSAVTFNGVNASITSWSDTQIIATVPSTATSGPVKVTVNSVASNGITFNVLATPTMTGISPSSGAAGTPVTITGTKFGDSYDATIASFGGVNSPATSWTSTSMVVPVPAGAVPGVVSVTAKVNNYTSTGMNFTVIATPNIASVSPTSGVAGTPVTIYGSNFGSTKGSSTITFNGVAPASITSWSSGSIVAIPPSNVTTGPVAVTVNSVPSNSNQVFTVTNPAIGSLSPPAAAVGAHITVTGSGLYTPGLTTQVLFNGVPGIIITYNGNTIPQGNITTLYVQVPTNATSGSLDVTVGSVASNTLQFTLEQAPVITGISPTSGQVGAWPITISGSGFGATQSNSSVTFYPAVPAQIVSWSDTSIQAVVPAGASTGVLNVQVATLSAQGPSFQITNLTQLTDSLGNQSSYATAITAGSWTVSSSSGSGCSTCSVRGNTVETVNANGNVLTHTDDLGHVTTYTYDSNNNVASVSQQLDVNTTATTSYTYNSFREVLTMTDALGNVTTNAYDANGNLTSVTSPQPNGNTAASVTHFTYDTKGELTQITDPLTNPTNISYTSAGLIATITDAQNHTTTYQYDTRGNRTAVIDPINGASHPTSFTYDSMNRLTAITYPDGSSMGFGYDSRGRRTSVTDPNQKTTTYAYDDADRLTSVTDPAQNMTQYSYDTEGNLTSITDANNHTTYFGYNSRGWVTQTTFPSTLAESYAYDAGGNLQTKTDRKNQTIQYVYDALNRLSSKTYPDSTAANYVYDLVGKIKQVNDPTGTYGFAYDNMGRLIGTTTQYTFVSGTYSNAYSYDAASNRASLTAPDGSISTYGYDTLNRLNGIANSWAGSFGFGYDALSRRTSLTRPNGVNTSYGYDSLSRLLSVLHQTGATTLDGASYTYDASGNRTSKTNYLNNVTEGYSYDNIYELTQVVQGATTTESYSYDLAGNRLSSLGVASYNYNSSNELTSNSLGSYTYDNNGNTLSDASKTYTWDFENRLTQVIVPGTGTVTFRYDPLGRRIQKSSSLGTTNYLYDGLGGNVLDEVDSTGSVVARYAQGSGTDQPLAELRSATTSYYEQDAVGSVSSLSSSTATIANTYIYDAFGKLAASTGTRTNPFQYTGREFDTETGLDYYRARYYDQSVGRFLTEDPIGFDGGADFYAYVANSPTNLVDPQGWLPKGRDRWYGYNDSHFHKWFHRCWKQPGDPDASKEEIEAAYEEWVSRGRPQNGDCWNGRSCKQKTMFEIQSDQQSAQYMQNFWTDILVGDFALGVVGTGGALGILGGEGAAAGGGALPPPQPIPIGPPAPIPMPTPVPAPIPIAPAA